MQKAEMDNIMLKNAIRLVIGGSLYDGGNIVEIPDVLRELADQYATKINTIINKEPHL